MCVYADVYVDEVVAVYIQACIYRRVCRDAYVVYDSYDLSNWCTRHLAWPFCLYRSEMCASMYVYIGVY